MSADVVILIAITVAIAAFVPFVVWASVNVQERIARKNNVVRLSASEGRPVSSEHPSVANSDLEPHMHVVDGVVITHAHAHGDRHHEHSSITVSMSHYAALVKRAEQRQSG